MTRGRGGGVVAMTAVGLLLVACTSGRLSAPHRAPTPSPIRPTPTAAPARPRYRGMVLTRVIPGTTSGFAARPAMIYLPPILRYHPDTSLPTVELFHGLPGAPSDWIKKGHVVATLDAYAAAHGGRAPIVVMPDINGARYSDSECVSTKSGDVEGYLTVDVRNYVRSHFPATDRRRRWTVAGLSEGGTCAIMLALRHPHEFARFGEFSGLPRPTVGDTDDRSTTIAKLFRGSVGDYDRHDPTWLMRHRRFPTLSGFFASGRDDHVRVATQARLVRQARAAGIAATSAIYPGGHDWQVWPRAFARLLHQLDM